MCLLLVLCSEITSGIASGSKLVPELELESVAYKARA